MDPQRIKRTISASLLIKSFANSAGQSRQNTGPEAVWSTLIGQGMSRLISHWSRASLVMLAPILCHKEPAQKSLNAKYPHWVVFFLFLAGSLCHKDSWLPCTERSYYRRPYAIKNQRGSSKIPPMTELVLYGMRLLAQASLGKLSTNERRASTLLDQ